MRTITLDTCDGHALEADIATPDGDPVGGVVVCHPHPLYGGNRHNPVVEALFAALPQAGFTTIRFDFRRQHDHGVGERNDVLAALDTLAGEVPSTLPLFVVGYSFGAMVTLTTHDPRIAARVAIAPPLTEPIEPPDRPTLVLAARHDQYFAPDRIAELIADWPDTDFEVIESADHFLNGHTSTVAARATRWLAART